MEEPINQGLKINPNRAESYKNRAIIFLSIRDFTSAIKDCERALNLKSQDADIYNN